MSGWTPEQQELRETIAMVGRTISPGHVDRDGAAAFDTGGWRRLSEIGLFGLPFAAEWGGLAQSLTATLYVLEELGYSCRDAGLSFSAVTHMVSTGVPLQRYGSPALRAQYLPKICSGAMVGAHAITEPDAGSDMMNMATTAVRRDDEFIVTGTKAFVSNGPIADLLVVYARTGKPGDVSGITAFLVRRDSPGLSVGRPIAKMGLRSAPLAEIFLDNVSVSADHVIGTPGTGFLVFDHVMKWEILCGFAVTLGEMQHRMERCVDYARNRSQFGANIGSYQAVSHRIVNMRIDLETSRKWIYGTAERILAKDDVAADISMTKVVVSEANLKSALSAVQIFGGYGYTTEYGVEKEVRNAVAGTIYSGTSEIHRERVATLMGLIMATARRQSRRDSDGEEF